MEGKMDIKRRLIDISKIVIFLCICAFLLTYISPIFVPKNNSDQSGIKYENARGFYGEKSKSVDVLAIGNSDLYSAMNPLQIWKEHGYTSYVCAEPQQSIFAAYYMLKEVLTCQKPKVVLLEVDELFSKNESEDIDEALNNAIKYTFPLFEYHSRWKDLTAEDFKDNDPDYNTRMESKGYIFHNNIKSNPDGFKYLLKNRKASITQTTQSYLKKFIKLAHENDAEVMFVWFPSATTATTKRHETVQRLAKSLNIPFVDFNIDQYGTGFNWQTDTRDGGNHLNYSGATKITRFLGKYLQQNYQLTDHRHDPQYEQWNKDYDAFMKKNKLHY